MCPWTYKTFLRCKALHAARIPDFLSFAETAALSTSITAYYALHKIARLITGKSVFVEYQPKVGIIIIAIIASCGYQAY